MENANEDCTCAAERWYRLLIGEPPRAALDCPIHGVLVDDDIEEQVYPPPSVTP